MMAMSETDALEDTIASLERIVAELNDELSDMINQRDNAQAEVERLASLLSQLIDDVDTLQRTATDINRRA